MKISNCPFLIFFFLLTVSHHEIDAQYCIPKYQNSCLGNGSFINKVTLNTLSNTASGCNGNSNNYILYPNTGSNTTIVKLGNSYTLTLKSGSGSGSNQGFGVWIDFNDDGDFNEDDEFVYTSPTVSNVLFSGTVTIPNSSDYIGERRMRVRSAKAEFIYESDACVEFDNGETEDYTITIDPADICTGVPEAGSLKAFPSSLCQQGENSELVLTGFSVASELSLEWQRSPDTANWTVIQGATNTEYFSPPLDTTSSYRVKVTCNNSGKTDYSNVVTIEVGTSLLNEFYGDTICGAGKAKFYASSSIGQLNWYSDAFGGIPFKTENTPSIIEYSIDTNTTFYVTASTGEEYIDSVGMVDSSFTNGTDLFKNEFLKFDVDRKCTLVGVYVYPTTTGQIFLQLRDQFFNVIENDTFLIDNSQLGNKVFLDLNYELEEGNGFQLYLSDESILLWSSQSNVNFPYKIPDVISIYSSNLGPQYYFYFYNWIINYSELCESDRVPVTSIVEQAPEISISSSSLNGIMCANATDSIQLVATSALDNFIWTPADGLYLVSADTVLVHPSVTTTYYVNATDGVCYNEASYTVTVANTPVVITTASADTICGGTSVQLNTTVTPQQNYIVSQVNFFPDSSSFGTEVYLDDEEVSSNLPIGFEFKFYDNKYSDFYISSNGFITFSNNDFDGCCTGQFLPSTNQPNNLIAFAWEDLAPELGGKIIYHTSGVAPNRKLIVSFDSIFHYSVNNGGVDPVTAQIMLYETSNIIEIHLTSMPGNPNANWFFHTEGIENFEGTLAATVPGRNANNQWTAFNDAWRFSPQEYLYQWNPSATLSSDSIANPVANPLINTNYQVTVTDAASNCAASASIEVNVIAKPQVGTIIQPYSSFCGSGSTELALAGYTSGASIQWSSSLVSGGPYTDIAGATSSTYQTPVLNTTTYYVAEATCIDSAMSDEVKEEILLVPSTPVVNDVSRCSPGTVELIGIGSGGTINWYDAETGGNLISSGDTIFLPINFSTTIYAESVLDGCAGLRAAADVSIYQPNIKATLTDSSICKGDTIMLLASNLGEGNFNYQWYPLLPVMFPADGVGDTIVTVPVISTLFTLIATEEENQCDTILQLNLNMLPTPEVSFTGLPDTMLVTDSPVLLEANPAGGVFTGPGIFNGEFFDPSIPGVGGPYAITYSYTNAYGCSDDTTIYVVVETGDAINTITSGFSFSIYPNPASEKITIVTGTAQITSQLNIFDNLGRVVLEMKVDGAKTIVDVSSFNIGVYFISIDGVVKKLLVERP